MIGRLFAIAVGLSLLGLQIAHVTPARAEPRIALVIGNSNYGPEIGKLTNPVNDANLIAQSLQQTGFQVTRLTDVNYKAMKRAIADFGDKLAAAGQNATGLFFYAGHGVQSQGANYLIPIDADISRENDIDIEAISADEVMKQFEFANSRVSIMVLDACRNSLMQRSVRSATRGLAPMNSAQGTFVAYSTAPGQTAVDGNGANSPYTKALASEIVQPGVGIEDAFREVRTQVMAATNDKQVPWDSSSLTAPFYFKPSGPSNAGQSTTSVQPTTAPTAATQKPAAAPAAGDDVDPEVKLWHGIQYSKEASDYQAYLQQYPNGTFAGLAKSRLAALGASVPKAQATPPTVQQPAAAPAVAPATVTTTPAPSTNTTTTAAGSAASDTTNGPLLDENGVDCRIMDQNRPENSICSKLKKASPANHSYSGSKSHSKY